MRTPFITSLLGLAAGAALAAGAPVIGLITRTETNPRCCRWPAPGWVTPNAEQTEKLSPITAVVLGGPSLFGGRGVIFGTLIVALIVALIVGVFRNGLTLMGVSSINQVLVTGILVILAVATDQLSRKGAR